MNIFHKIQLATVIAIITSVSILVYVDQAFAIGDGPPKSSIDLYPREVLLNGKVTINGTFGEQTSFTSNIFKLYEYKDQVKLFSTSVHKTDETGIYEFDFTALPHWPLGNYEILLETGTQKMGSHFMVRNYIPGMEVEPNPPPPSKCKSGPSPYPLEIWEYDEKNCDWKGTEEFCQEVVKHEIPVHRNFNCWPEPIGHPLRDITFSDSDDPVRLHFIEKHCQNEQYREFFGELRYLNDTHVIDLDTCQWGTFYTGPQDYDCPDNEIYYGGVCMTQKVYEKSQETIVYDESQREIYPGQGGPGFTDCQGSDVELIDGICQVTKTDVSEDESIIWLVIISTIITIIIGFIIFIKYKK